MDCQISRHIQSHSIAVRSYRAATLVQALVIERINLNSTKYLLLMRVQAVYKLNGQAASGNETISASKFSFPLGINMKQIKVLSEYILGMLEQQNAWIKKFFLTFIKSRVG